MYSLYVAWIWYGWPVLALGVSASASIVGYALILYRATTRGPKEKPQDIAKRFVTRVLIPCYKKRLEKESRAEHGDGGCTA